MENISEELMKNLTDLTELENNNLKIKSAIFLRNINEKIQKATNEIELRIDEEIKFYGQKIENYAEYKDSLLKNYFNEFEKISEEYELQFISICEELIENYANQKIAIANCKKIKNLRDEYIESDKYKEYKRIKAKYKEEMDNSLTKVEFEKNMNLLSELINPLDEFELKMKACIEKANDYEMVIQACNQKLEECKQKSIAEINKIVSNKTTQLVIYENNNIISKIINKITNIFSGKKKLKINVIDRKEDEINILETETNSAKSKVRENTIKFIERLIGIKEDMNNKFNKSIKI